jgi:hypothetical protein
LACPKANADAERSLGGEASVGQPKFFIKIFFFMTYLNELLRAISKTIKNYKPTHQLCQWTTIGVLYYSPPPPPTKVDGLRYFLVLNE